MKVLFVGDVHCKQHYILYLVDEVVRSYRIDKVVFLGDYVDEWYTTNEVLLRELDKQVKWYYKNMDNLEVVHLTGNHDWSYVIPSKVVASGHRYGIERSIGYRLRKLDLKIADSVSNFLVTHAGVTSGWWKHTFDNSSVPSVTEASELLNNFDSSGIVVFVGECSESRGGSDYYGGPLWADRVELESDSDLPFNQIVGHTPVTHVSSFVSDNGRIVKFCDTLSITPDGKPIGNAELLVLDTEDNSVIQVTPDDVDCQSFLSYVYKDFKYNMYVNMYLSQRSANEEVFTFGKENF